jgi:hypothetical protein
MTKNGKSHSKIERPASGYVCTKREREIMTLAKMLRFAVLIPGEQFQEHFNISKRDGLLCTADAILERIQEL